MVGVPWPFGREVDRLRKIVEATPVSAVGTLSPGVAAVEGAVRKHRESVDRPLGDGECVVAHYQRRRRDGEGPRPGGELVESDVETVPFVVEDNTGETLVDPREADTAGLLVSAGNTDRYFGVGDPQTGGTYRIDSPDDEDVEEIAQARQALGENPEWVHVESVIRPGDEVYVLGDATETPGGSPPFVVSPADDGALFVLSDLSRSALIQELDRQASGVDREFWLFAVLGVVAVIAVLVTIAVLADSFFLWLSP